MRRCGRSLVQRVSITADRGELLALCGAGGIGNPDPPPSPVRSPAGRRGSGAGRRSRSEPVPDPWMPPRVPRLIRAGSPTGPRRRRRCLRIPATASVLLLERPTEGLDDTDADASSHRGAPPVPTTACAVVLTVRRTRRGRRAHDDARRCSSPVGC